MDFNIVVHKIHSVFTKFSTFTKSFENSFTSAKKYFIDGHTNCLK